MALREDCVSLSKLLTKSYNTSQDIQIRYVVYTKVNSCFIDRFNEEPKNFNEIKSVAFFTQNFFRFLS